jgi:hypothetical protein
MTSPPSNGPQYRVDQLEIRHAELRQSLRELQDEMRDRSHNLQTAVAAAHLLCNSIPDVLRRLESLERHEVGVIANDVTHLKGAADAQAKKLDGIYRVLWTIAAALIAAALTLAISIATGRL